MSKKEMSGKLFSQSMEIKNINLQRKLRSAMEYATNICVLGSDNKIEDIRKTNGWSIYQKYRYHNSGRYLKLPDGKFSEENDGMCNAQLDPNTGKLIYRIKKWYYHPDNINKVNEPCLTFFTLYADKNPLVDPQFKLHPSHLELFADVLLTISKREGNCGPRSKLVSKYLMV